MSEPSMRVLLIEDEDAYAALVERFLKDYLGAPCELVHVHRLAEGLTALSQRAVDVIVLDLSLPDSHGLETFQQARSKAGAAPIVILTGVDDEKLALEAVRLGAQDYLAKAQLDGKVFARVIRYAIERKRSEQALQSSERFFRLISENVSDLIAVLDEKGRRLYNNPSYGPLLGDPKSLVGTDSFEEVHPEDRDRIRNLFYDTLATGVGHRAEYRMVLKDGSIRYIESRGSAICDETGRPCKVVVVSRDVTEHKEHVALLRQALSDLKASHEALQATQRQLIQAEKLEAVSTFAAGVAHEVKNPLQTIILGVDFLSQHFGQTDEGARLVLEDMAGAVHRADSIIRGLMEFATYKNRQVQPENLNQILEQALPAVECELSHYPVRLERQLTEALPPVQVDARTLKHVFINLCLHAVRTMNEGGRLVVRTFLEKASEVPAAAPRPGRKLDPDETLVVAQVEEYRNPAEQDNEGTTQVRRRAQLLAEKGQLGLTVLKKIVELYSGMVETQWREPLGACYTIRFRAQPNGEV